MLKLENIHLAFDGLEVLRGLSCRLERGDFVSLMGCNGAGKSSLFNVIAGTLKPDRGRILVDGEEITGWSERRRAPMIGRLFQNTRLASVETLTLRENLALAALKGRSAGLRHGLSRFPEELVEKVLRPLNLGLDELLDLPMGVLSGGQRQLVSFVMATLVPPRILLLDEPTAALSPQAATELLIFAKKFVEREGISALMITHDPEIARHMSNQLWVVEGGSLRTSEEGGVDRLLEASTHGIEYKKLSCKKRSSS